MYCLFGPTFVIFFCIQFIFGIEAIPVTSSKLQIELNCEWLELENQRLLLENRLQELQHKHEIEKMRAELVAYQHIANAARRNVFGLQKIIQKQKDFIFNNVRSKSCTDLI
jgi:hypothetical protein